MQNNVKKTSTFSEPLLVNEIQEYLPKTTTPCCYNCCSFCGQTGLLLHKSYLQKKRSKCECCMSFCAAPIILFLMWPLSQSSTTDDVPVQYGGLLTDSVQWFPTDFIDLNDPAGYEIPGIFPEDADDNGWGQTNMYNKFNYCDEDDQGNVDSWMSTCATSWKNKGCDEDCKAAFENYAPSLRNCANNYIRWDVVCNTTAESAEVREAMGFNDECGPDGTLFYTPYQQDYYADELLMLYATDACDGPHDFMLQTNSYYSRWFQSTFDLNGQQVNCSDGFAQCVDPVNFLGFVLCRDAVGDADDDDQIYAQPKLLGIVNDGDENASTGVQLIIDKLESDYNYFKGFYTYDMVNTLQANCILQNPDTTGKTGNAGAAFLEFSDLYEQFNSQQELEDYVGMNDYAYEWNIGENKENRPIAVAFEVLSSNVDDNQWKIKLRGNLTYQASTNPHDFTVGVNFNDKDLDDRRANARNFEESGFIPLMLWVSNAVADIAAGDNHPNAKRIKMGVHEVPQPSYTYNSFMATFGWAMPLLFGIAFMYPFSKIVTELVEEKASKLTEGLRMMGSTTSTYWISWSIYYFLSYFCLAFILTSLTKILGYFQYSDFGYIFSMFFGFLMQMVTFAYLLSTIFDNPKMAGMMSCFVFLMTSFLFTGYAGGYSPGAIKGLSFIGNATFGFLVLVVAQWEEGQFGLTAESADMTYNGVSANFFFIMIYLDIFIYLLLALYLEKVWPFTKFGQRLKPWYFLDPAFWWPVEPDESKALGPIPSQFSGTDAFEEVTSSDDPVVKIRGLVKKFGNFTAVNNVNYDLYEGECFALLGHNGAGKTTTMSMMTGLIDVTEGDASMHGYSIRHQMTEIRKFMGVCPQHDVLFSRLTAIEHMRLYAGIKKVDKDILEEACVRMIVEVGLQEKINNFPQEMSGGQRRKLSLGIALIGGSKVVFLDEPTSGMDPESRRAVWNLIEREKRNRVIVLTTHFMDEADELGDRIAIMVAGQIRCCGSSTFLKQRYGVGYSFVVSCNDKPEKVKDEIFGVIKKHLDEDSKPEESTCAGTEICYRLPYEQANNFPDLFDELDKRQEDLCIDTYGISVTTLEEVFMRVGHMTDEDVKKSMRKSTRGSGLGRQHLTASTANSRKSAKSLRMSSRATMLSAEAPSTFDTTGLFCTHFLALLKKKFHWTKRDQQLWVCSTIIPTMILVLFLTIQLELNYSGSAPELELVAGSHVYVEKGQGGQTGIYSMTANNSIFSKLHKDNSVEKLLSGQYADVLGYNYDESTRGIPFATNEYWGNNTKLFKWKTELKDWSDANDDAPVYTSLYYDNADPWSFGVGTNLSTWHGFTAAMTMYSNTLLKYMDPSYAVVWIDQPLPKTARESNVDGQIQAFMVSIYLIWAFSIAPGVLTFNVVREKQRQTKHQQLVSGVTIHAYWITNWLWDFLWLMLVTTLITVVVACYSAPGFAGENLFATWLVGVVWGFAMPPFCYLFSFLLENPATALSLVIGLCLIGGTAMVMIHAFFAWFLDDDSLKSADDVLVNFYRIIPIYPLGESLLNIAWKGLFDGYFFSRDTTPSAFDWEITGRNFMILFLEAFGYLAMVWGYEYAASNNMLTFLEYSYPRENYQLDSDVAAEQDKVKNGISNDKDFTEEHPIVLAGLRKCFKGKIAVRDLYYCVEDGECFGFLGVNGAGKTTSLNMLSGKFAPTEGSAFINGFPITDQLSCRRSIGYCPQFDALFDYLTAREHLWFYARIKGMEEPLIEGSVNRLIKKLGLTPHADKPSMTYSGGNKRKLSVGIALIGSPPIVFMDEPSTGMDPGARRDMWEFISETMTGRSVILTTHSMEECEALCHRIGIMVAGQLECLGTSTHLKNKFGAGYQVDVTYNRMDPDQVMWTDVKTTSGEMCRMNSLQVEGTKTINDIELFTSVNVLECHESAKYAVGVPKGTTLAGLFRCLEEWKKDNNVKNYSVSQTTLEQIFIQMAKKGESERSLKPLNEGGYAQVTGGPEEVQGAFDTLQSTSMAAGEQA